MTDPKKDADRRRAEAERARCLSAALPDLPTKIV